MTGEVEEFRLLEPFAGENEFRASHETLSKVVQACPRIALAGLVFTCFFGCGLSVLGPVGLALFVPSLAAAVLAPVAGTCCGSVYLYLAFAQGERFADHRPEVDATAGSVLISFLFALLSLVLVVVVFRLSVPGTTLAGP